MRWYWYLLIILVVLFLLWWLYTRFGSGSAAPRSAGGSGGSRPSTGATRSAGQPSASSAPTRTAATGSTSTATTASASSEPAASQGSARPLVDAPPSAVAASEASTIHAESSTDESASAGGTDADVSPSDPVWDDDPVAGEPADSAGAEPEATPDSTASEAATEAGGPEGSGPAVENATAQVEDTPPAIDEATAQVEEASVDVDNAHADEPAPVVHAFAAPHGAGSAAPNDDGSGPNGWTIKGNADSMLYHTEASPYYGRTKAEVWFETEDHADAAGFTRWDRREHAPAKLVEIPPGPYGAGSAAPNDDGSGPEGWTIKGNADSMIYHTPASHSYHATKAEVWFDTEERAVAAGFRAPRR